MLMAWDASRRMFSSFILRREHCSLPSSCTAARRHHLFTHSHMDSQKPRVGWHRWRHSAVYPATFLPGSKNAEAVVTLPGHMNVEGSTTTFLCQRLTLNLRRGGAVDGVYESNKGRTYYARTGTWSPTGQLNIVLDWTDGKYHLKGSLNADRTQYTGYWSHTDPPRRPFLGITVDSSLAFLTSNRCGAQRVRHRASSSRWQR